MSLSASTAWEVRPGGSDTANSGGFRFGAWIAAPSTPAVTPSGSGGTVAAGDYYIVLTYTDNFGETVISPETHINLTGTTSSFVITKPTATTGALTWSAYVGTVSGGPYFPQGTGLTFASNRSVTSTPPTSGTQPRGVNYSVQDAAQVSVSDAVANGTTTVTSATAGFTGAHVGNVVKIGSTFYDLVAVTNGTTIVVDAAIGTASGLTLIIGGGFATPGGQAGVSTTASHICFMKAGSYTIGNGTFNTAGNYVLQNMSIIGYDTNRTLNNTDANKPSWNAGADSLTMLWGYTTKKTYQNLKFANPSNHTNVTGFIVNADTIRIDNCIFDHVKGISFNNPYATIENCDFVSCMAANGVTGNGSRYIRCLDNGGAGTIFLLGLASSAVDCLSINNAATGPITTDHECYVLNCTVYNFPVTGNGIALNGEGSKAENCIVWGAAGTSNGYWQTTAVYRNQVINCAVGNCGTNIHGSFTPQQLVNITTLTGIPFTNAGAGDLSLNNTAGAGAACRDAGIPGVFPGLATTTGYRALGAIQPSAAGVGAPTRARVFTGM